MLHYTYFQSDCRGTPWMINLPSIFRSIVTRHRRLSSTYNSHGFGTSVWLWSTKGSMQHMTFWCSVKKSQDMYKLFLELVVENEQMTLTYHQNLATRTNEFDLMFLQLHLHLIQDILATRVNTSSLWWTRVSNNH